MSLFRYCTAIFLLCIVGCTITFRALFAGGTIAVITPFRSLPRNSAPWFPHSQNEARGQGGSVRAYWKFEPEAQINDLTCGVNTDKRHRTTWKPVRFKIMALYRGTISIYSSLSGGEERYTNGRKCGQGPSIETARVLWKLSWKQ